MSAPATKGGKESLVPLRLALSWQATADDLELLRALLPDRVEIRTPAAAASVDAHTCRLADLLEIVHDAEIVMGWVLPEAALAAAERLRLVQVLHAGVDHLDLDLLRRRKLVLGNVSGANAAAVAEHGMALVLALAKRILPNHLAGRDCEPIRFWHPDAVGLQLAGKTMAIIGLGRIGTAMARRARAFELRLVGVRRGAQPSANVDVVYASESIDRALSEADVVAVCAPLTPETRGMFDEDRFGSMKPSALLVNVARAEIVDEYALHKAITERWIAGFASDVWWSYPSGMVGAQYGYPSLAGVHRLPNVVVSPDMAANTPEVRESMVRLAAENVAAYVDGRSMPRQVELSQGY